MKRIDKTNKIIHIVMCVLNLGSIFYALMVTEAISEGKLMAELLKRKKETSDSC